MATASTPHSDVSSGSAAGPVPTDPARADFEQLELRIARRADELVREQHHEPGLNRHCWLLAEAEIAGDFAGSSAPSAGRTPGENEPRDSRA